MTDNTDMQQTTLPEDISFAGAATCPSCSALGEFDLPTADGSFDIACHECDHLYEISAETAINTALLADDDNHDNDLSQDNASSSDDVAPDNLASFRLADGALDDIDPQEPTRFDLPPVGPGVSRSAKAGIIVVSILSAGLITTAAMIALGLYFLTLRADSDVTRYIEANILQLSPAQFDVQNATYELSETDVGTSLLVTITISNSGQVEGTPEEMRVVLTDTQNKPLITWPLDVSGQIIAPGQTTQLYTRLFEPPSEFANLRVFVR